MSSSSSSSSPLPVPEEPESLDEPHNPKRKHDSDFPIAKRRKISSKEEEREEERKGKEEEEKEKRSEEEEEEMKVEMEYGDEYVVPLDPEVIKSTRRDSTLGLPPGWTVRKHKFNSWTYYYHPESNVAVWARPYIVEDTVEVECDGEGKELPPLILRGWTKENLSTPQTPHKIVKKVGKNKMIRKLFFELDLHPIPLGSIRFRRRDRFGKEDTLSEDEKEEKFSLKEVAYCSAKVADPPALNPANKTPVSFLQEYSLHALGATPRYFTSIQDNPAQPFVTRVVIDGQEYAMASFTNKRQSKQLAAEATLLKLCPELWKPQDLKSSVSKDMNTKGGEHLSVEEWENLEIDDQRVFLNPISGNKTPAQIIQEHCNRHSINVAWALEKESNSFVNETIFILTGTLILDDGERIVVVGKGHSKKEAKQIACQLLLKELHPDCKRWKDILDKYLMKVKDSEIISKSFTFEPNKKLLNRLKEKMEKLYPPKDNSVVPPEPTTDQQLPDYASIIAETTQPKLSYSRHSMRLEKQMIKRRYIEATGLPLGLQE